MTAVAGKLRGRGVVGCAKFYSRSHDAVIRVYDEPGNVVLNQFPLPWRRGMAHESFSCPFV